MTPNAMITFMSPRLGSSPCGLASRPGSSWDIVAERCGAALCVKDRLLDAQGEQRLRRPGTYICNCGLGFVLSLCLARWTEREQAVVVRCEEEKGEVWIWFRGGVFNICLVVKTREQKASGAAECRQFGKTARGIL